jgi:hypothetical protein
MKCQSKALPNENNVWTDKSTVKCMLDGELNLHTIIKISKKLDNELITNGFFKRKSYGENYEIYIYFKPEYIHLVNLHIDAAGTTLIKEERNKNLYEKIDNELESIIDSLDIDYQPASSDSIYEMFSAYISARSIEKSQKLSEARAIEKIKEYAGNEDSDYLIQDMKKFIPHLEYVFNELVYNYYLYTDDNKYIGVRSLWFYDIKERNEKTIKEYINYLIDTKLIYKVYQLDYDLEYEDVDECSIYPYIIKDMKRCKHLLEKYKLM